MVKFLPAFLLPVKARCQLSCIKEFLVRRLGVGSNARAASRSSEDAVAFAPEERDVYSYERTAKGPRCVRSETRQQKIRRGRKNRLHSYGTLGGKKVPSGYKRPAPSGAKRQTMSCRTSNLNSPGVFPPGKHKNGRHLFRVTPCSNRNPLGMRRTVAVRFRLREREYCATSAFALANWLVL